mmetsp:Transcript_13167/g.20449  ORF Transcript_13167/g.20449 Transcript_13167/m.20449 type:complete len:327 (-) Transcript_13167:469-1449(-)
MKFKSLYCHALLSAILQNAYIHRSLALSLQGLLGDGYSKKSKRSLPRQHSSTVDGVEYSFGLPAIEYSPEFEHRPPALPIEDEEGCLLIEEEQKECPPSLRTPQTTTFVPGYFNTLGPVALQSANIEESPSKERVPRLKSFRGIVFSPSQVEKNTTSAGTHISNTLLKGLVALEGAILSSCRRSSEAIRDLFSIDKETISSHGIGFGLSYTLLSTINGAFTLSFAWYLSCKKTGISPLYPGQWKSLAAAYGTIYVFIQMLKPFRLMGAIALSKSCRTLLQQTQERFDCSRGVAIALQYSLGLVVWAMLASMGIGLASLASGVSVFR